MTDLRIKPTRIGFPKCATSVIVEKNSGRTDDEIAFANLTAVHEADRHAVSDERSKFFHQVKRECRTAVTRLMHKAEKGIKANRMTNTREFLTEHAVPHRKQGIHRITRWTTITLIERKAKVVLEHRGKCPEIECCGASFETQKGRDINSLGGFITQFLKFFDRLFFDLAITHQENTLIMNLGTYDFPRELQTDCGVTKHSVLTHARIHPRRG